MPKATSKATPKTGSQIYQLKITLKGIRPPVWRRVQVKSTISLGQLHEIIQFAMGWTNSHMHSFDVGGEEYGQPEPSFDFQVRDEAKAKLNQLVDEKAKFSYTYDFGDSWDHEILVEKVLPADPEADYPL
ncbi:MAG: plasmid pRiA4b ORF-3 family protein, partial [Oculatellaceae cyanobacterium Prado106]|nr:plasmid pRiA4b ORF-3 family protein [Oculatellaceae cyanobacterium Prado106]